MTRVSKKDFTFSDGTFVPKGIMLAAPVIEIQKDAEHWEDPLVFNPWRFSEARERSGDSAKYDLFTTSLELPSFGHGRHAW